MPKLPRPDENPFTRLTSRPIYKNPWITVIEDQITKPDGEPGIYGRVHFKNLAIGIIPVDDEGYTWLVGQYRYMLDAYSWEIPMGGGPVEIDPLESAKRELREETGFTAASWTRLMRIHTSNSVTDELGFVYLARDLTPGPAMPDGTEVLDLLRLPLADAIELVYQGEITDSVSVGGLLFIDKALRDTGTLPG